MKNHKRKKSNINSDHEMITLFSEKALSPIKPPSIINQSPLRNSNLALVRQPTINELSPAA